MRGKLTLIGCGGAGINMSTELFTKLKSLGDEFADVDIKLLDTTDKTIQAHESFRNVFSKLGSKKLSDGEVDGTGGERKNTELARDLDQGIKEWLDKSNLSNNKNDYYAILFSSSGGSGSLQGPLLLKAMLQKDYNVIVITVGDSSNLLNLNNTINTLTTLQQIAKKSQAAISVIYYNNTYGGVTTPKTEKDINEKIYKVLTLVNTFISGNIQNLDHQDMGNFFRPSKYKTFTIAPGIYSLGIAKESLKDDKTLLSRTIIKSPEDDVKIEIPLLHNKTGIISDGLKEYFDEYPIYLLFRKGVINQEVKLLKEEIERLETLRQTSYDDFDALETSDNEDDLGLVL